MKKTGLLVVCTCLMLSLVACGGKENDSEGAQKVTISVDKTTPAPTQGVDAANPTKEPGAETTPSTDAPQDPGNTPEASVLGKFTEADGTVTINGVGLSVGMDFLTVMDKIGKADDIEQGQGCLDDGFDTNYYYSYMTVYTLAKDNKQVIYSIRYTNIKTDKGLEIGKASEADLIKAYGEPDEDINLLRQYVVNDHVKALFIVDEDVVTELTISDKNVTG